MRERGAASVEQIGLIALVCLLFLAAIAAVAARPAASGTDLASTIGRKLRCSAALPGPCWRDPLTAAYGRAVAGAVRALATAPQGVAGPDGVPLVPVDFRYCRSAGC